VLLRNKNIQDSCVIFICGAGLLCYALFSHYNGPIVEWKMSPSLFPVIVSVFLMLLSVSLLFDGLYQIREAKKSASGGAAQKAKIKPVLVTIALSIAYFVVMRYITFIPATILFLGAFIFFLGERRYWLIALIAVITALAVYAIFGIALSVRLP
jgi:putative tricarboxylic transport membrane protein